MSADFDIASILAFRPPTYMCPVCRGLFAQFAFDAGVYSWPVCKVTYIVSDLAGARPCVYQEFEWGG